jgi:CRP-like cAMP-binding protein
MLSQDLTRIALFDGLAAGQVRTLAPLFRPVCFVAGEAVFAQGDPAERVFVLVSGRVALRMLPEDGGSLTIAVIHPGGVFGWSAALGRARYTSSAVAETAAAAVVVRGDDLRAFVRADETAGRLLLGRMALAVAGRAGDAHAHAQFARLIGNEMTYAQAAPESYREPRVKQGGTDD